VLALRHEAGGGPRTRRTHASAHRVLRAWRILGLFLVARSLSPTSSWDARPKELAGMSKEEVKRERIVWMKSDASGGGKRPAFGGAAACRGPRREMMDRPCDPAASGSVTNRPTSLGVAA